MRITYLLTILAGCAALAAGCKPAPETTPPTNAGPPMPGGPAGQPMPTPGPMPGSAPGKADAAAGKLVFASKCAGCHGPKGEGRLAGTPKFADPAWQKQRNDAELLGVIRNGKGRMPSFQGRLSEKEIADVEAHVRTLGLTKSK